MKNVHEVEITVKGKKWEEALNKSFEKNVKDAKIDGFRKGKCPRNIFEKKYGKESLFIDAVNYAVTDAYDEAIKKDNLVPIVTPKMDLKKVDEKGCTLVFTITTKPDVEIKKYKGLGVKKQVVKVTKKEVDEEVNNLLSKYADLVIKEGKVEKGDTCIIDFEGFLGKKAFEGGKGENYPLEIGSGSFIPGFEEQLIGKKANDDVEVKVTFPEDYHAEELKGKEATFKVKIHEVKTKEMPKLDKDFFMDLGLENVDTEEQLRDLLKADIEAKKEHEYENKYIDDLLAEAAKNTKVDIPEELVDDEINRMMKQYEQNLSLQGVTLEMFYQFTNSNELALKDQMRPEAEKRVKYRFMLEEIVILEKIKVSDKEVDKEVDELAKKYNTTKEEFLKQVGGTEMIKYDLEMQKAMEVLKEE